MISKLSCSLLAAAAVCMSICFLSCRDRKHTGPVTPSSDSSMAPSMARLLDPANSEDTAYGIDISKFQGDIVENIISRDGLSFIICRATMGKTEIDTSFAGNWAAVKEKELTRGAYHFYYTLDTPEEQAQLFMQTLKRQGLDSADIPPILDIEPKSIITSVTIAQLQQDVLKFLALVEQLSGRVPMIYTNLDFANTHLNNTAFTRYPLWLADYSDSAQPGIPDAWQQGYTIWQKTSHYTIDSERTDYDVFNGTREALYRFVQGN